MLARVGRALLRGAGALPHSVAAPGVRAAKEPLFVLVSPCRRGRLRRPPSFPLSPQEAVGGRLPHAAGFAAGERGTLCSHDLTRSPPRDGDD